ncbi:MAG: hypothetical protein ACKVU4_07050 [Phycisphaerales bacterium]
MKTRVMFCAAALAAAASAQAQEKFYILSDQLFPQLREVSPQTGAIVSSVPVTGHESLFGGLAALNGSMYSVDGYNDPNPDRLFRIDPATGAGTVVGPTGFNWNFRSVYAHPTSGVLYGTTDGVGVFTFNLTTGAATLAANFSGGGPEHDQITAFAINAQGQAYCTDIQQTSLFGLNLQTGALSFIANIGGDSNWFEDLAFDSAGTLWGARFNGGLYTINTTTGAPTLAHFGFYKGIAFVSDACYPDCNASGGLTVADFGCFQGKYVLGDLYADCNASGSLTVADFGCFQGKYVLGCP